MTDSQMVLQASVVVEHLVPRGKGLAFRLWHARLAKTAQKFEGYIRADLCPPVVNSRLGWVPLLPARSANQPIKWYAMTHFDSPESLNRWINSPEREQLIESGRTIFSTYQFKSFATGLEGWFSNKSGSEHLGLGPPAWKQNLAVVLGLYPVVMVQTLLFSAVGIMQGWTLSSAMLVNNLITSSLLTWLIMPLVTKGLSFWLRPSYSPGSKRSEWLGLGAIALMLGLLVVLFQQFE
ncbi:MAG: hypothetical protein KME20_21270 [Kaiparowitsia implicata GSE-PSE-MK54-09C]|jgi:antibiotic biosynthesis monooxygenase (ABM) superfamily enzyme|nr:hypothetical protein [Kaiparowitsia implicata GSE-PSE-MK54-09C]